MSRHVYRLLKNGSNGELELAVDSDGVSEETDEPGGGRAEEEKAISLGRLLRELGEWSKHPANIAMLVWFVCVGVSTAMLVLLFLGVLDGAFPSTALRNQWIEINYQLLNALFTLLCLYEHPKLFHHTVLLLRWQPADRDELREVYCKSAAARRPCDRDRAHMAVVVVLLHITLFSQYALCGLYWGYSTARRPELADNLLSVIGTVAPVLAGVYANYGPLRRGNDEDSDSAEAEECQVAAATLSENGSFPVIAPEWEGGMFDCGGDGDGDSALTVGFLSCFCTFCLFGWNMERLGFGNMYVHAITFALLCFAPFLIFNVSALNIHDNVVGDMVGAAGIVLCAFGLLYGGYYRIQMRKRYGLPAASAAADYARWMFCWPCALAQEVRTGSRYDVEDGRFYMKKKKNRHGGKEEVPFLLQPLPREAKVQPPALRDGSAAGGEEEEVGEDDDAVTAAPPARRMERGR